MLTTAILLSLPPPPSRAADGPAMDLLAAYRLARLADPLLAAAGAARRGVDETVVQARAALLPQASAGLAVDRRHDSLDAAGRGRSAALTAQLNQVILDPARTAQLDVARLQARAQAASLREADQALCVRVATAYFGVLGAADTLANVEANEDAFRRQVDAADQRWRNGLSALVDVNQARAYHAAARARSIDARSALADAREALGELTGTPTPALKALRPDLPLTPPAPADEPAWVALAQANNAALAAGRQRTEAAEGAIAAARAGHAPTLTADVGLGRSSWAGSAAVAGADRDATRTVASVGLLLTLPLSTGGATESRVRQAVAQRDASADELEALRRRVARDTLDRYRRVLAGIGQVEASRAAVDAAQQALESTRVGLSLGTQTMTDLLLAIQTLSAARESWSQARHRTLVGGLLLKQSAGTIGEDDLAAVNALLD